MGRIAVTSTQPFPVMVISPHPDDAEIGMGGTMAALQAAGVPVILVDLTDGEPTPFGSVGKRREEALEASRILGLTKRVTLPFKNREIFDTVENRKLVAAVIRQYRPDILFLPYWDDGHPDHINASTLGVAARFYAKLSNTDIPGEPVYPRKMLHFFSTHIRPKATPSFIFDVTSEFEKKLSSVAAYRSQFTDNPNNLGMIDMLKNEGAYWGSQIGVPYGEPFISREQIKLSNPHSILDL